MNLTLTSLIKSKFFLLVIGALYLTGLTGQEYYDIKMPGNDYYEKCEDCLELLKTKPPEVQFGIQRDESDNLYFVVTHKEWYEKLIKKGSDGLAIDIVTKERYSCEKEKINRRSQIRGKLQKPIYLKELKQLMLPSQNGQVLIKIGRLPKKYEDKEVEFNVIFIKNKYLCHYNNFYDLKSYKWDLLEMGMFMDTLTYKNQFSKSINEQERYILSHKTLRFEIPFEKNKSTYSHEDIKPLYDSLRLTNFNIKKITINAYSSVEGNTERNIELQNQRANSIISALQEFQEPAIINEVFVAENWVEFLNDISISEYSQLADLSKTEIKEKLKNKDVAKGLESYLKNHRKAIVILELQRKDKYGEMSTDGLVELFHKSISEKNLEQAIEIQNSVFDKVRTQKIPAIYIDKFEIPNKIENGSLLNKRSVFKYMMNQVNVYETYLELKKLEELLPKDGHIKYNVASAKFKVWLLGEQLVDPVKFKAEISGLKKYGISNNLIKRMLVNYNIIMCEYYMQAGDFYNKDRALKYIYMNYKYLPLTNTDYLSLAQYFSSYTKYDWAKNLLAKKVKSIDINEDLLFYYLNLTLIDEKITKRSDYRTIMLNAININRGRFCEIFNSVGKGGITFQLLENDYLKRTYCENCNN